MALRQLDVPVSLAGHAATFVAALDATGAPWWSGLWRAGLPTEMADPLGWLPTGKLLGFVHDMAWREGIPHLGILVGQKEYPGAVHPVLVGEIQRAPTLFAALMAVCKHAHLQGSHISFSLHVAGDALLVRHQGSVSAADPGAEQGEYFRLVRLIRLIRAFLGQDWQPAWLCLATSESPPPSLVRYTSGCAIRTGRPCGEIPVPLELIGCPMPPDHVASLVGSFQKTDIGGAPSDSLERLKAILASYLPTGGLTISEMSEIAGLKPRTFQRLLADNQTSYRELMDLARFEQARKLLEQAELSLSDVARLTGYTDASNFARAFRRLAGRGPADYRKDLLGQRGFGSYHTES